MQRNNLDEIAQLKTQLTNSNEAIATLEEAIQDDEKTRRRLHNEIQELKGNIRVFCRVRPILKGELDQPTDHLPVVFPDTKENDSIVQKTEFNGSFSEST